MADPLFVRCPACGANNRVAAEKLQSGKQPLCGRCHTVLVRGGEPLKVTDSNFAEQVENSPVPVLLDMWAPWCGPCRYLTPVVDQLASELAGKVRVGKLNVDENPSTAARFGVQSIPTLLVIKGGREVDRMVGVQPKQAILQRVLRLAS